MNPTKQELEILESAIKDYLDNEVKIIVLVSGYLADDVPHYAYISMSPKRYMDYTEEKHTKEINARDYGEILAHGNSLEPPENVKQDIEKNYDVDHLFEEKLRTFLKESENILGD